MGTLLKWLMTQQHSIMRDSWVGGCRPVVHRKYYTILFFEINNLTHLQLGVL